MESHCMTTAQPSPAPPLLRRSFRPSTTPNFLKFSSMASSSSLLNSQKDGVQPDFSANKRMFILGMGYVGQFFAQQLKTEGWDVAGTCTSITKKKILEEKGLDVHVFDALEPEWKIFDNIRCCSHLLVSIPPTHDIGDPILQHGEFLEKRLMNGNLRWLSYLSTTSIYGDAAGAWIDENYIPKPPSNLAKMRLKSEEGWLKLGQDLGLASYVFRLGGIYGPGRSAINTILKKEKSSVHQKRRATRNFTSRVHVVDICQALKASISLQQQRSIYNVVDDDPASRAEVFAFAQQLIERRWPDLIIPTDNCTDNNIFCGDAEKRVCNANIKKELGVKLVYPCYRSGLQSIIDTIEDSVSHCNSENNC
ncbi:Protein YeeZ [Bienertia sinuspersici]